MNDEITLYNKLYNLIGFSLIFKDNANPIDKQLKSYVIEKYTRYISDITPEYPIVIDDKFKKIEKYINTLYDIYIYDISTVEKVEKTVFMCTLFSTLYLKEPILICEFFENYIMSFSEIKTEKINLHQILKNHTHKIILLKDEYYGYGDENVFFYLDRKYKLKTILQAI